MLAIHGVLRLLDYLDEHRRSNELPYRTLLSLASLDGVFQLQEYISLVIRLDMRDVNSIVSLPGNLWAKDKEKEAEVSPKDKGKKSERVVGKGKAEPMLRLQSTKQVDDSQ